MIRSLALACTLTVALSQLTFADDLASGTAAYRRKEYATAMSLLEPLARGGSSQAQVRVGQMFYFGQGVNEDEAAAFGWFSRAATQGNAEGQTLLAGMYLFMQGPAKDDPEPDVKAAQWYFAAARQGHPEAQYNLGLLFAVGKGVRQSDAEARKWMQRAAAQGHAEAKAFLRAFSRSQ